MTIAETGCGVDGHDGACSCDVVIEEPIEERFDPTEVFLAHKVVRQKRLGKPWTSSQLADLWDGLTTAYDAYRRVKDARESRDFGVSLDAKYSNRAVVTELLGMGESILDVPRLLDVHWVDVMGALTHGKTPAYAGWSEMRWLEFESVVLDESWTRNRLAKHFGIHFRTVAQMGSWYGREF